MAYVPYLYPILCSSLKIISRRAIYRKVLGRLRRAHTDRFDGISSELLGSGNQRGGNPWLPNLHTGEE